MAIHHDARTFRVFLFIFYFFIIVSGLMIDILPVHLIMDISNTDNLIYDTTQQVLVIY